MVAHGFVATRDFLTEGSTTLFPRKEDVGIKVRRETIILARSAG